MQNLLLLQARLADDPMLEHEHLCVATQADITPEYLVTHNLIDGPPNDELLADTSGVVLGGSGAFYASAGDMPHFESYMHWLRNCVSSKVPVLGICYGHHCLARALGAEVFHGPQNAEVGSYWLDTCAAASTDPLFETMPTTFAAQLGHKDHLRALPPDTTWLAKTKASPYQAFKVADAPVWGVQFHPELTDQDNRQRFLFYVDYAKAVESSEDSGERLPDFVPSPEANLLLSRFKKYAMSQRA